MLFVSCLARPPQVGPRYLLFRSGPEPRPASAGMTGMAGGAVMLVPSCPSLPVFTLLDFLCVMTLSSTRL